MAWDEKNKKFVLQGIEKDIVPCRVFLVEDDIDDRILSKKRLEASNKVSDVVCFSDGAELLEYMKQEGFDDHSVICLVPTIIIVDLNMPKVSGFDVLRQLKKDPFLQEIPIVVVSGNVSYENVVRAHELRADGFFRKPLNIQKIQTFLTKGWQWPTREMWLY